MQNRDYFENLPETQEAQASSHFVIGIEEKSFSVFRRANGRMHRTSAISTRSQLNAVTRMTAVNLPMRHTILCIQLAGFLCKRFNLTSDDVIRHYDVTEKLCPLYYVEHEDAWIQMKADIQAYADSLS